MHRHVGDQRTRRHITRRIAAQQRLAQLRRRQLDDIESGLAQRDADNLELLALAGQRDRRERGAGRAGQDRLGPGLVDRDRLGALLDLLALVIIGIVDRAQPFGDLAIRSLDAQLLARNGQPLALQRRLHITHRDGQHPALLRLDDPEWCCKLHQRRRFVEAYFQREALAVGQHPPALVLQPLG